MASIPVSLRVHASSTSFPICDTPQALDIGLDGSSGNMVIYRISGSHRTLIDIGNVLSVWSRWLPTLWGIKPMVNRSTLGLEGESKWSCVAIENSTVQLTTANCGPPIKIACRELEAALILIGGHRVQSDLSGTQFPEYSLGEEVTNVARHNHKIHQIAQEVEEIEL